MGFFTEDFADFFKELEQNNDKTWFDKNRKRYEEHVKEPFQDFTGAVRQKILDFDNEIDEKPYIFRINRDLRFQPDADPYKLNRTATFQPGGRKSGLPGYYLSLSYNNSYAAGGLYEVPTKVKGTIREYIADNLSEFQKLLKEKSFVKYYQKITGKTNKRVPKNIQEAAENEPLLYNAQWYFSSELPPDLLTSNNLLDEFIVRFKASRAINVFFRDAIKS